MIKKRKISRERYEEEDWPSRITRSITARNEWKQGIPFAGCVDTWNEVTIVARSLMIASPRNCRPASGVRASIPSPSADNFSFWIDFIDKIYHTMVRAKTYFFFLSRVCLCLCFFFLYNFCCIILENWSLFRVFYCSRTRKEGIY